MEEDHSDAGVAGVPADRRIMRIECAAESGNIIAVDLPSNPTPQDVATARHELARVAATYNGCCPSCFTPRGMVHFTDCSLAPEKLIDSLRREAGL